jgi:hypothetical protein
MAVYMVERDLQGITMDQLAAAQRAAIDGSRNFTSGGRKVRYIRTTFLPDESRAMCLFQADNADDVATVNRSANIPYNRIVEALDLTP